MFSGSIVALVTPFNDDLTVNYDKISELVEWHIANGTNGILACGTTGENATLSDTEHLEVIRHVIKVVGSRVPVVAGTGSNDTEYSLHLSREAEKFGADALLLITPYYLKTNDEGLYQHFAYVADRVKTPIILYNVPSRTTVNIPIEVLKSLAKHPNIAAIKEAHTETERILQVAHECPDLAMFSGNDSQILPVLSLGGVGVISVVANVFPKVISDICRLYKEGNVAGATALQVKYAKIMDLLFIEPNPIPVKEAMNELGLGVGGFRLPLYPMEKANKEKMLNELKIHA
ncbi:MAG: 4-hydroxy-tetrahydrodipicolinate synthase [Bacteroidales bacterium]|jgi:4-hydroxy-tetrahydrodipicolinate synthase|nr:4-hydroxy-tetrahydrodipicolinate synthase [Bacteroidales bacterium]